MTKTLLEDFDKRYHPPAGNVGKVKFTCRPETGKRNRYTGVHPYFFIAAFLDLCTRKGLRKMMVPDQYQELHEMILGRMVDLALDKETKNNSDDRNETNNKEEPTGTSSSDELILHLKGCMIIPMMMMTQQLLLEQTLTRRVFESDATTSLLHTNFLHQ